MSPLNVDMERFGIMGDSLFLENMLIFVRFISYHISYHIMQVFLQMVAFSLQSDGSGRPVLTKGKRPVIRGKFDQRPEHFYFAL